MQILFSFLKRLFTNDKSSKRKQLLDKEKNFKNICGIGYLLLLLLLLIPYDHLVEG
jgi:hypothetical protein